MWTAEKRAWDGEGLPKRDQEQARRLTVWMAIWAVTFLAAIFVLGPVPGGASATPWWAWCLAALPIVPGSVALRLYVRYLRDGDELVRRMHTEAAAVGFGVGSVMSIGFYLVGQLIGSLEDAGAVTWVGMWMAYSITLGRARRRYL